MNFKVQFLLITVNFALTENVSSIPLFLHGIVFFTNWGLYKTKFHRFQNIMISKYDI